MILALALAIRLLNYQALAGHPLLPPLAGDEAFYDVWARTLLERGPVGDTPFFTSPLHAYFLAAVYKIFGPNPNAVLFIQILMGTATCYVIYLIAARIFSARVGLLAEFLAACYPIFMHFELRLQKTTASIFLFNVTILVLLEALRRNRPWLWYVAGLSLGINCLSRENYLLLAPFLVVWLYYRLKLPLRRFAVVAGLLVLGLLSGIAPATLHNFAASRELIPITFQGGQNFYIGNTIHNRNGTYAGMDFLKVPNLFSEQGGFKARAEEELGHEISYRATSSYWLKKTLGEIAGDPGHYFGLLWKKLRLVFNDFELPDNVNYNYVRWLSPSLRLPLLSFGLIFALGLVGLAVSLRRYPLSQLLLLIVLVQAASLVLFFVVARYRTPIISPLLIGSSALVYGLAEKIRLRDLRALAILGTVVALLYAFSSIVPADFRHLAQRSEVTARLDMARRHHGRGETDRAARALRKAKAVLPRDYPSMAAVGNALVDLERYEEAEAQAARLRELQVGFPDAETILGRIDFARGRYDDALAHFRSAYDKAPRRYRTSLLMTATAQRLGRLEAETYHDRCIRLAAHGEAVDRCNEAIER